MMLPLLILGIFLYAFWKKKNAYDSFMEGAKDGIFLFPNIYPTMLAMSFAISLLRTSGLMNFISSILSSFISFIPVDIIPMVLFRPFSGAATLAMLADIFQSSGVDSLSGIMASIIQGSTDTTLYVISLYFAHVGVKNIKNSLSIGLIADIAGIGAAIFFTLLFFTS